MLLAQPRVCQTATQQTPWLNYKEQNHMRGLLHTLGFRVTLYLDNDGASQK
jgi:hypothetical protein